jgi:hypothetical protein
MRHLRDIPKQTDLSQGSGFPSLSESCHGIQMKAKDFMAYKFGDCVQNVFGEPAISGPAAVHCHCNKRPRSGPALVLSY